MIFHVVKLVPREISDIFHFTAIHFLLERHSAMVLILGMCSFQHKWASELQLYLFVLLHHVLIVVVEIYWTERMPRKFGDEIRLPGTTGIDNLPIPLTMTLS